MPSFLPCLEVQPHPKEVEVLQDYRVSPGGYYALMPSSRWPAKEWGAEHFLDLVLALREQGLIPLLLGREKDEASCALKSMLLERGVEFRDALLEADFTRTAMLLRSARFYAGCDTGMSHLAESVGCPSVVIFGPTRPELGFGPCRSGSRSVSIPLSCAPCSKDGRICLRITSPNQCMKGLPVNLVLKAIREVQVEAKDP
jgi:ADP-heptose:LPS heptosyltransferase